MGVKIPAIFGKYGYRPKVLPGDMGRKTDCKVPIIHVGELATGCIIQVDGVQAGLGHPGLGWRTP